MTVPVCKCALYYRDHFGKHAPCQFTRNVKYV